MSYTKSSFDRLEQIDTAKATAEFCILGYRNCSMYAEYELSCEVVKDINKLVDKWGDEHRGKDDVKLLTVLDQTYRAAYSVPLNIAEGIGKGQGFHMSNYKVAQGSLYELLTCLKTCPYEVPQELKDKCLKLTLLLCATMKKLAIEKLEHLGASEQIINEIKGGKNV